MGYPRHRQFFRGQWIALQGLPGVCAYIDDLLITGETDEEHLKNLDAVLARFQVAGVCLKLNKCAFMLPEVEYLGHRISARGLHPTSEKVKALNNAPTPTNVTQLKSFLGLLNYYNKFLPSLRPLLLLSISCFNLGSLGRGVLHNRRHLKRPKQHSHLTTFLFTMIQTNLCFWPVMHLRMEWVQCFHISCQMDLINL